MESYEIVNPQEVEGVPQSMTVSTLSESSSSLDGIKRTFSDHQGFKDNKAILD